MTTRFGTCRLCKKKGQELQDSHYQPAGVYRVLRDETEGNPDPLRLTDQRVVQNSRQVSDYLLCWDCEQRFNRKGENWFLANCWRRKRFRLASLLDAAPISLKVPRARTDVYQAARIPGLNISALAYFGSSMFWRASVHRWEGAKGIDLGPYEERLRQYLMSAAEFPVDCALVVSIPTTPTPIVGLSLTPYGRRLEGYHCWKLVLLGVSFHLYVGKKIPETLRQLCCVRGEGNPICKTDLFEQSILQDVSLKLRSYPRMFDGAKRHL